MIHAERKIIFKSAVAALIGLSALAHADGSGVRGGGQVVDVDSTPALVDLVGKAVCDWQPGSQVVTEHPSFMSEVIKPLARLDWYFADDLLTEAQSLRFCFTGPLYRVLPSDPGSPVKPPNQQGVRQIGYRLNDTIYIDADLFNDPKMTEYTRAYVILHEVIHTYFPMDLQDRQLKLRSMVKAIGTIESGKITTRDQLYFQMRSNEIAFPTHTDQLDAYREPIEYLISSSETQEQQLTTLTESQVDAVVLLTQSTIVELAPSDRDYLLATSPKAVITNACVQRMVDETLDGFEALLNDTALASINPLAIALSNADQLSSPKQAILFSQNNKTIYQTIFAQIMNASLSIQSDGRAVLDQDSSELLGVETGEATPVLDLPMPTRLPSAFRAVTNMIVSWASQGKYDLITSFAGPQSPFQSMITLQPIHQAIQSFKFTYSSEQEFSDRRISLISEQLVELMKNELKNRLSTNPGGQYDQVIQILFPQNQSQNSQ